MNFQKDFSKIYKKPEDLLNEKFGPFMQDLCAIDLIIKNNSLNLILEKKYQKATKNLSNIWASFPKNDFGSFYKNQKSQKKKNFIKDLSYLTSKNIEENSIFKKFLKNLYEKNLKNNNKKEEKKS